MLLQSLASAICLPVFVEWVLYTNFCRYRAGKYMSYHNTPIWGCQLSLVPIGSFLKNRRRRGEPGHKARLIIRPMHSGSMQSKVNCMLKTKTRVVPYWNRV